MRFPESICDTNTFIKNICMFINIYKQVLKTLQLVVLYIFIILRERKKITEHYF